MQIRSGFCLVLLTLFECAFAIQAAPAPDQVTLKAVFPASPAQLLPDEAVHFKLHYTSAQPARIWVRPYTGRDDKILPCASHGSPVYPAGAGVAGGWFSCPAGTQVDAISIELRPVNSSSSTQSVVPVILPLQFHWTPAATALIVPQPAWVAELSAQRRQLADAYRAANPPEEAGWVWGLLIMLVPLYFIATLIFSLFWGIRWRGGWRWLARLPALAYGLIVLNICVGVMLDSTSHNLWPFELLLVSVMAGPYLFLVWLIRRGALRRQTTHT